MLEQNRKRSRPESVDLSLCDSGRCRNLIRSSGISTRCHARTRACANFVNPLPRYDPRKLRTGLAAMTCRCQSDFSSYQLIDQPVIRASGSITGSRPTSVTINYKSSRPRPRTFTNLVMVMSTLTSRHSTHIPLPSL